MMTQWTAPARKFTQVLGVEYPIIQAPMAGGPTTPPLVAAVSNAGGLGSLGAGYLSPEKLRENIRAIRDLTNRPFGVNVFIPETVSRREVGSEAMAELRAIAADLQVEDFTAEGTVPDLFEGHLEVLVKERVPVVTFTFGTLPAGALEELKRGGCLVAGTATSRAEAVALAEAGCDAVVAQGIEAGGHRGSFLGDPPPMVGLLALVPQVVDAVEVPVVAAGGIMGGDGIVATLVLGASAAQLGTAFLGTVESGADRVWVERLRGSDETAMVLTKTFSGKLARGAENDFIRRMTPYESELPDYPIQNVITGKIRAAAKKQSNPEALSLWAGQGAPMVREMSAAELVETLVREAEEALDRFD